MSINFKSGRGGGAKSEKTYEGYLFTGCPRIVIPCPTNARLSDGQGRRAGGLAARGAPWFYIIPSMR